MEAKAPSMVGEVCCRKFANAVQTLQAISSRRGGRVMEQLRFSRGLVTPLILYRRVIFSRSSRTLLWSVFIELKSLYFCL